MAIVAAHLERRKFRTGRVLLSAIVLASWAAVAPPTQLSGCPICAPLPTTTDADRLIDAEFVLFTRTHPNDPFSYQAIEVLKGSHAPDELDVFVDSTTRRVLKANPDSVVVLVRAPAEKNWICLGVADSEYQQIVRRILVFSPEWKGVEGRLKRWSYFLTLFGHQNQTIFELAYLELGRAPYRWIKRAAKSVRKEDLYKILNRRTYFEWRALAILMLAQRANDRDREYIDQSFRDCVRFSLTTNVAAWATAFLELHNADALELIERTYLQNERRSEEEIRAIVSALSVHGHEGHVSLRDRIVKGYGVALRHHPYAAGLIAKDLLAWEVGTYGPELGKMWEHSSTEFDRAERRALKAYLDRWGEPPCAR